MSYQLLSNPRPQPGNEPWGHCFRPFRVDNRGYGPDFTGRKL